MKGVSNLITLRPRAKPEDLKHKIEQAFVRSAELDAKDITVESMAAK